MTFEVGRTKQRGVHAVERWAKNPSFRGGRHHLEDLTSRFRASVFLPMKRHR